MTPSSLHQPRFTPTIKDVAEEANVSRASVSRAFTQPHLLKCDTVKHIRAVAKQLGYVPNHTARALSTGRAGNIALIVPDITNPFFAALMRGAQARASDRGYATFIGDSDETPELEDTLLGKLSAQVEGFVLASPRLAKGRVLEHARRRPLVLVNRDLPTLPRLLIDAGTSYWRAVEYLASFGHRSIAYVAGPDRSWSNRQKHKAVATAAQSLGLRAVRIATSRPSFAAGKACTGDLLRADVTAGLVFDDVMAQGIMAGLAGYGCTVPTDFSLVGCDDVIANMTYPPLTSVAVHCAAAGKQAVDLLLGVLRGKNRPKRCVRRPTELVVRETTGPVPANSRSTQLAYSFAGVGCEATDKAQPAGDKTAESKPASVS